MNRWQKTEAVLEAIALAQQLREHAVTLDLLSACASEVEAGTLRRQLRAVRVEVVNRLDSVKEREQA